MARKAMLGRQVRRLRRERGLSQVALAKQLGISASYLNLIEHNQRPLTLVLQSSLAEAFGIDLQAFSQDEEAKLLAGLRELFADPLFATLDLADAELRELAESAPAVGRAALELYRAYRGARDDVVALGGRLSADSFLSTSPHELRTLLTSIRSFSEILMDYDDLEPDKRQQFIHILVDESQRLSLIINQMLDHAIAAEDSLPARPSLPAEAVGDLLQERDNHFEALEAAAEAFRAEAGLGLPVEPAELARVLETRLLIAVRLVEGPADTAGPWRFEAAGQELVLSSALTASGRSFELARCVALARHGALLDSQLEDAKLGSEAARTLAREVLAGAFAAALLMPYDAFAEAARESRHDVEALQARFGVSFEQCCQRLSSLNRPGARGLPFHFLRVDLAGNLSKRFTASGLQVARFGGLCPRMAVHQAFLTPGRIVTQVAEMPNGSRYFDIACALAKPETGFRAPRRYYAVSLGCESSFASDLVYADGLDPESPAASVPVGITCSLCERADCQQRAAPLILPRGPLSLPESPPDQPAGDRDLD